MSPRFSSRKWCATGLFLVLSVLINLSANSRAEDGSTARRPTCVAMMDFTTDDGLIRSAEGGAQCAALTQETLARQDAGVVWIERAQLQLAADEMHLSVAGFTSAENSLRVGHWLKADLAVRGRFTRNEQDEDGHTLQLEIVDLAHADTIVTRTLPVPGDRRETIAPEPALVSAIASALHEALTEARDKLAAAAEQRIIAPLFFQNADASPRLDHFGSKLHVALIRAVSHRPDLRLLRFPVAEAALDESDLAVRGLTVDDADGWKGIADLYVWGVYRELPAMFTASEQTPVEIELTVWDGVNPMRQLKEKTVVAELPTVARRLAGQCMYAARKTTAAHPPTAATKESREVVARELRMQGERLEAQLDAHGTQRAAFLDTIEGKSVLRQAHTLLEAACFFAPGDRAAQLGHLRARWDHFPVPTARRPLLELWQFSNDLAGFAERFGDNENLARNRVQADVDMLEDFDFEEQQDRLSISNHQPLPIDASDENVIAWHATIDERFARDMESYAKTATAPPTGEPDALSVYNYWLRAAFRWVHDPAAGMRAVEALLPLYKPVYRRDPRKAEKYVGSEIGSFGAGVRTLCERLHQPERARLLLNAFTAATDAPTPAALTPASSRGVLGGVAAVGLRRSFGPGAADPGNRQATDPR